MKYLQHHVTEIENHQRAVIVALNEASQMMFIDSLPKFFERPVAWRPVHARILQKLVNAGATTVVFDLNFKERADEFDGEFMAALDDASRLNVAVVLSFSDQVPTHPFYEKAFKGVGAAVEEQELGMIKNLLLYRQVGDRAYPSLAAQAWSLWNSSGRKEPAEVKEGVLYYFPDKKISQPYLWWRYARDAFKEFTYAAVLSVSDEQLRKSLAGKAVFVGVTIDSHDLHPVPSIPLPQNSRPRHGSAFDSTYGVYLHAHAFNQLQDGAFVREISFEGKLLLCVALGVFFVIYFKLFKDKHRLVVMGFAIVILILPLGIFLAANILAPFATILVTGAAAITLLKSPKKKKMRKCIFVVHGRDTELLKKTKELLYNNKIENIILQEQPNQGRTIIEKFEDYADTSSFAIVLLTPDDVGGLVSEKGQAIDLNPRARQNVIAELAFFHGKLGRSRVCIVEKRSKIGDQEREVEIPSDYSGVMRIIVDDEGKWKDSLLQELKVAGFKPDKISLQS